MYLAAKDPDVLEGSFAKLEFRSVGSLIQEAHLSSCSALMLSVVRLEELGEVLHSFLKVSFNSVGFGWLPVYTPCRRSGVRFLSILPAV